MNRARLGLAALIALAACQVWGLDPSTPLSQFGHDVWTSDSGLPQNSITTILQTRDGYLWLGTQEGLVRFDGVRFTIFDTRNTSALNDDWVQALLESRDGTLWIGTVTGLARRSNGVFLPAVKGVLERAIVTTLFESRDGSVWVGSSTGICTSFPVISSFRVIVAIHNLQSGSVSQNRLAHRCHVFSSPQRHSGV